MVSCIRILLGSTGYRIVDTKDETRNIKIIHVTKKFFSAKGQDEDFAAKIFTNSVAEIFQTCLQATISETNLQ